MADLTEHLNTVAKNFRRFLGRGIFVAQQIVGMTRDKVGPVWNRHGRTVSRYFCFGLAEITAVLMGLMFFGAILLNNLLVKGEVKATYFIPNASETFSEVFEGQTADIGNLTVRWDPPGSQVWINFTDVIVTGEEGEELQRIDTLQVALDYQSFVRGQMKPREILISGGSVTWKRDIDGRDAASLGTPETFGRFGNFFSYSRDGVNRNVGAARSGEDMAPNAISSTGQGGIDGTLDTFQRLSVENATLYFVNEQTELNLRLNDANLQADIEETVITISSMASPQGGLDSARIALNAQFSADYADFDMEFIAQDFNAATMAPKLGPFSLFERIDAPLDINLVVTATREAGLSDVDLVASSGSGEIMYFGQRNDIERMEVSANYNAQTETLDFTKIDFSGQALGFNGKARLRNIGSPTAGFLTQDTDFDISATEFMLDARPTFQTALDIGVLNIVGAFSPSLNRLDLSEFSAEFDTYTVAGEAKLRRTPSGVLEQVYAKGGIVGDFTTPNLLDVWPVNFVDGARRWIERSVLDGAIENLRYEIDLDAAAMAADSLPNDAVSVTYDVVGGAARYISTMTPITNVDASGRLNGNRFVFDVRSATVGDLQITDATIDMPRLVPKGDDMIISINGRGNVEDMLFLIDQPPFMFAQSYGISPENFGGKGVVNLVIRRPLREFVDARSVSYSVSGDFSNVSAPFAEGRQKVSNADVSLVADASGLVVEGQVELGAWRPSLIWADDFKGTETSTTYTLEGMIDQSIMDDLGFGVRDNFDGEFKLSIDSFGKGVVVNGATFQADFTNADLRLGQFWAKPKGVVGQVSGSLERRDNGQFVADSIVGEAPGLSFGGAFAFGEDFSLVDFNLRDLNVDGFVDAGIRVQPSVARDSFNVRVNGEFLDISALVSRLMSGQAGEEGVPVNLVASIDGLALNRAYVLSDSQVALRYDGKDILFADVSGQTPKGEFTAAIGPNDVNARRGFDIKVPDASAVAFAFFDLESVQGGEMRIRGTLPPAGDTGAIRGTLEMENFVVRDTPVLARLLSLASLKGLTDTLGGLGLAFNTFEFPFSYTEGVLKFRDAKMSGAALGITSNGDIDLNESALDVDGVLVPAYTANSILEDIPVIGGLLGGKDGEGVLAVNYTVTGTFDKTQIAVNPISALTPGFLRRMFDVERDDIVIEDEISLETKDVPTGAEEANGDAVSGEDSLNEAESEKAISPDE